MTLSTPLKKTVLALGMVSLLVACSQVQSQEATPIRIDGSSTVYPITQAVIEAFKQNQKSPVDITAKISGTGGGFAQFCQGETAINDASRPIQAAEIKACRESGVRFIELPVAFDAITVVVNPQNDWVNTLTLAELKTLWETKAEGKIKRWNQVREGFPDRPINLFGADKESGTYDYFNEAITGEAGASRQDYVANEDDNLTVQGVSQDPNALGYFGLAYYEQHQNQLKAVAIDNGKGAVLPARETVANATYQPLARPLFIYVNATAAQKNPILRDFVQFYLKNAGSIVEEVGYVPLPPEAYEINQVTFHNGEVGTVFEGKSQFDLTIAELLRKRAKF